MKDKEPEKLEPPYSVRVEVRRQRAGRWDILSQRTFPAASLADAADVARVAWKSCERIAAKE